MSLIKTNLANFADFQKIYFIGLGGIGLSALAKILQIGGKEISGSDKSANQIIKNLAENGVQINSQHLAKNIDQSIDLVIYSEAIAHDNPEILEAKKLQIPLLSYPQALGKFSENYRTIAICGSHGKTTTTALAYEALMASGIDPHVIIGTIYQNFGNQNFHLSANAQNEFLLIEACEYKNAFGNYSPEFLVITGIDHDHFDYYPTFDSYQKAFADIITRTVQKNGSIIFNADDEHLSTLIYDSKSANAHGYTEKSHDLSQIFNGLHNQYNANAAIKLAEVMNSKADLEQIIDALKKFPGTQRRFEKISENPLIIDDYAHHPSAIKTTLAQIQNQKTLVIFEPHQYSRTSALLKEFASSFANCEQAIITDIYAARDSEADLKATSSAELVKEINKVEQSNKAIYIGKKNLIESLLKMHQDFDLIIFMGAGEITKYAHEFKQATLNQNL